MHFRMILEHFQNNTYSDLEFDSGLTVIKGTNNQGKSTLRRALQAVILNNPRKTKNYIQKGASSCSVTIEVEGYKQIIWKKTKNEVIYIIDGIPTNKAGRLNLFDVYPDNPFTIFDTNLVNIIAQKERPLPFGQTTSQTFQMFEELYGILSTKEDIGKFNTQLATYNTRITQNNIELDRLHTKNVVANTYKQNVDTEKLNKLYIKLQSYQDFLDKVNCITSLNEKIQLYKKTEKPITLEDLENTIQILKKIKHIKTLEVQKSGLKQLEIPVNSIVFSKYSQLTNIVNLQKLMKDMDKLETPITENTLKNYNKLQDILTFIKDIDKLQEKRNILKTKIEDMKKILPVCPTCNRPF